ncbi:MAG: GDCCVxC domain-containing (seleno)protein [Bacteroidia bacterium]
MQNSIKLKSVVKCPICKYKKEIIMPTYSSIVLYECEECNARLKPRPEECCIFCSYGSVPCPNTQKGMQRLSK